MIWFITGLAVGLLVARGVMEWADALPEQERIKRILAADHDADGLVKIMASAKLEEKTRYGHYPADPVRLSAKVGDITVVTPTVPTVPELLPHIPKFQAQVEALQAAEIKRAP